MKDERTTARWKTAGAASLFAGVTLAVIAYVSAPPKSLHSVRGEVLRTFASTPSKGSPKWNLVVYQRPSIVNLYTDCGAVRSPVHAGDIVDARYQSDVFGRNWHRLWELRRGNEVLLSSADTFAQASAEARAIFFVSLVLFVLGSSSLALGWWLQQRVKDDADDADDA